MNKARNDVVIALTQRCLNCVMLELDASTDKLWDYTDGPYMFTGHVSCKLMDACPMYEGDKAIDAILPDYDHDSDYAEMNRIMERWHDEHADEISESDARRNAEREREMREVERGKAMGLTKWQVMSGNIEDAYLRDIELREGRDLTDEETAAALMAFGVVQRELDKQIMQGSPYQPDPIGIAGDPRPTGWWEPFVEPLDTPVVEPLDTPEYRAEFIRMIRGEAT